MDESKKKRNLPRLSREAYRGLATVHWVFNIDGRKKGWLDDRFLARFRYLSIHAFSRYKILSPCICLMPDHIHLVLMGYSPASDQKLAIPFLRTHLKAELEPEYTLQKTPYDHVLRKEERTRNAFARMTNYVMGNPFRAGLTRSQEEPWPYSTCEIPGYPELRTGQKDFWDRYWRIYSYLVEKHSKDSALERESDME